MEDRILDTEVTQEDTVENSLRPTSLNEFVGQKRIKYNLGLYIEATKAREEALDHVLLSGPPGLGKTTMAHIIADGLDVELKATSGPALERAGDLVGILTSLGKNDVLFIDEIHRLSTVVEELLYQAMEEQVVDIVIDSGPNARSLKLTIQPFTLIGATTREGFLSAPFRSRFGILEKFDLYPMEELEELLNRSAGILSVSINEKALPLLAQCSRGTPRVANRILRRVRDVCQVKKLDNINEQLATEALGMLGIDSDGLDQMDRQILKVICNHGGQAVGLKTIAVSVGEEESTIEDVYEPYLIREGFLYKSSRGRLPSEKATTRFGKGENKAKTTQQELF